MKFIKSIWIYFFHYCFRHEILIEPSKYNDGTGIYECQICKTRRYFGGW